MKYNRLFLSALMVSSLLFLSACSDEIDHMEAKELCNRYVIEIYKGGKIEQPNLTSVIDHEGKWIALAHVTKPNWRNGMVECYIPKVPVEKSDPLTFKNILEFKEVDTSK